MCESLSPIPPKTLANAPKDFGMVPQRLWDGTPKTLGWQMLYHTAPYIIPSSIVQSSILQENLLLIKAKNYITMRFYLHRDGVIFSSRCKSVYISMGKTSNNDGVFFIPGFHLHDGIPSACSHPGVVELMVYHEFSTTSNF